MSRRFLLFLSVIAFTLAGATGALADEANKGGAEDGQKAEKPVPEARKSVTEHSIRIGGKTVDYEATAGTLILKNDKEEPIAEVGYIAYTKKSVDDPSDRPVTFAYNGGPGSSSIWLHMGALGPKRIVTNDPKSTPPPPYDVTDNAFSIIDKTDLVMIDPVGTGLSDPVGKGKDEDFWGVDEDIHSVGDFIKAWVSENDRWNSPKYLLGESYGTMRSAGVVDYLQSEQNMAFNGVILVSVFVDANTAVTYPGNDLAFEMFLPTYAAVAWYQDKLDNKPEDLEGFLQQARDFAMGEYADALAAGNRISREERQAVIEKMSHFTGLSRDYLAKADLRVTEGEFTKELLRDSGKTVGRLDSRYTGVSFDLLGQEAQYDPQSAAISSAFVAAFMHYLHHDLKFGKDEEYMVSANQLWTKWDWKHQPPGVPFKLPGWPSTGPDLAHAMGYNPDLQILVLNGYFDLATPFLGTEYTMDHLELAPELRDHIHMKYFKAGHMMYLHQPALEKFKSAIGQFIDDTDRL